MIKRRKINYIRSTKDPNIFKLSFMDRGKRVVIKKQFNDYSEAVDWLEAEELRIEERKWEEEEERKEKDRKMQEEWDKNGN